MELEGAIGRAASESIDRNKKVKGGEQGADSSIHAQLQGRTRCQSKGRDVEDTRPPNCLLKQQGLDLQG